MNLDINYANTIVGIKKSANEIVDLLKLMGINSSVKD